MSVKVERPSNPLVSFLKIHHLHFLGLMKLFIDEFLLVSLTLAGFIHSKKSACKKKAMESLSVQVIGIFHIFP